ncbi:hypothetical protein Esti_006228 [Eimeria stiedai]
MLGENPLRPQDPDLVDVFPPTVTPPMTKAFQIFVDRASAHLELAKPDQKAFADVSRRPLEFSQRTSCSVLHLCLSTPFFTCLFFSPTAQRPQDMASPPGWEPIGKASDGHPVYEVESILDQQGEGEVARYSGKWKVADAT